LREYGKLIDEVKHHIIDVNLNIVDTMPRDEAMYREGFKPLCNYSDGGTLCIRYL